MVVTQLLRGEADLLSGGGFSGGWILEESGFSRLDFMEAGFSNLDFQEARFSRLDFLEAGFFG